MDWLLIGGAVIAGAYILNKQSSSSSSGAGDVLSSGSAGAFNELTTPSSAPSAFHTTQLNQAVSQSGLWNATLSSPVVSSTGHIIATDIYKGRASINQAAQIANILSREGQATPITLTNNPLEVQYQVVGGQTFTSSRRPSNEAERQAAKAANIKSLGGVRDSHTGELIGV